VAPLAVTFVTVKVALVFDFTSVILAMSDLDIDTLAVPRRPHVRDKTKAVQS
jgi:hypothetical protein